MLNRLVLLASLLLVSLVTVPTPAPADNAALHKVPWHAGAWPLGTAPSVARRFDPPAEPWQSGHRGVDLVARPGVMVRAPMAGTVEVARTIVDRGVVVIRSGRVRVTLEPVRASVQPGTGVQAGDPVGVVTVDGSHCAPTTCLHWGMRVGATYRDPLLLVLPHRAVLLPLRSVGQ